MRRRDGTVGRAMDMVWRITKPEKLCEILLGRRGARMECFGAEMSRRFRGESFTSDPPSMVDAISGGPYTGGDTHG
jgi:hypothetical protein